METPTKRKTRQSKFSPEIASEIIARISEGEPLAKICRDDGMPDPSTVWDWRERDQDFAQAIARAREIGHDRIASDTLEIADATPPTSDDVAQSKLRIWTRLQLLAKWDPKRYGERIQAEHSGPNGGAIPFEAVVRKIVDPKEGEK